MPLLCHGRGGSWGRSATATARTEGTGAVTTDRSEKIATARRCTAIRDERSLAEIRTRAAALRAAVVPDWLAELVRPKPAPLPWPDMIRTVLAVCVPLGVGFAVGKTTIGLLPAVGGLLGSLTDRGGSYLNRVKRVSAVGVFGGAAGLAIGSAIHGRGWIAVIALVVVAGVSAALSTIGDIGSQVGLQLLVYTSLGIGPFGALRPVWHTAAGFLVGVVWALVLILPGWLLDPYGQHQRYVAAVYQALANQLAAIGTDVLTARRQAVTAAVNAAYDELLSARAVAAGRNRTTMRLIAALNASNQMSQAATTLGVAGNRPPPMVIETVRRLAEAIRTGANGSQPPMIPPVWDTSPGAVALRDSMVGVARVLARDWTPGDRTRATLHEEVLREEVRKRSGDPADGIRERILRVVGGGQISRTFAIRLMTCMGVAGVVSEVLPLQRSYWVPLTVAIVLKPDYGSVFARALQRGIGTIVGAVAGAVLLALFHGAWLLIPFGVLAALLPYGRDRNYGLQATFLTPLVVVLVDLLNPIGWGAGRGAAGRHADRLRDRAGYRVRPVADGVVRAPAGEVRAGGAGCLRVHARCAGRSRGLGSGYCRAAAVDVPGAGRPAGGVPAHDVRTAVDQPQRDGLVARGGRPGTGAGHGHGGLAGGGAGGSRAIGGG
ncbi:MAG TPA: FUSC family protein [Streptosporangiaceae bacterium]|nr:FUSC family protein [Streptosporangiaceae bacterium]